MKCSSFLRASLLGVGFVAATMAFPAISRAATITYTFLSDHCTGLCGPQPGGFGTVTITDTVANTVNVSVSLNNGNIFVDTGGHFGFTFNLLDNPVLLFTNLDLAHWTVVDNDAVGFDNKNDGAGNFDYALDCINTSGSSCQISTLTFTITAAGLSTADFNDPNALGNLFAADILSGTNTGCDGPGSTCTGAVDVSAAPGPIVGAGLPGLVLACGGLIALGRRRRRKAA